MLMCRNPYALLCMPISLHKTCSSSHFVDPDSWGWINKTIGLDNTNVLPTTILQETTALPNVDLITCNERNAIDFATQVSMLETLS